MPVVSPRKKKARAASTPLSSQQKQPSARDHSARKRPVETKQESQTVKQEARVSGRVVRARITADVRLTEETGVDGSWTTTRRSSRPSGWRATAARTRARAAAARVGPARRARAARRRVRRVGGAAPHGLSAAPSTPDCVSYFLCFVFPLRRHGPSFCVSVFPVRPGRPRDRVSVFPACAALCFRRFCLCKRHHRHFSPRAARGINTFHLCFVFRVSTRRTRARGNSRYTCSEAHQLCFFSASMETQWKHSVSCFRI